MDIPKIIEEVRSGVISISFIKDGEKVASGSGFLLKDKVVSNNHIFHLSEASFAKDTIVVFKNDGTEFRFNYSELAKYVVSGSTKEHGDYIVLDIKNKSFFKNKFFFNLGTHDDVSVGQQILILGYPFDHEHLTTHIGHVSAKYTEADVNIIQLDASINNGNSGGPLLDLVTKKVVGIVTRKATGLMREFDGLIDSFDKNAQILERLQGMNWGKLTIGNILSVPQRQMKGIAVNIKRSANVGIGYAFSCDQLLNEGVK